MTYAAGRCKFILCIAAIEFGNQSIILRSAFGSSCSGAGLSIVFTIADNAGSSMSAVRTCSGPCSRSSAFDQAGLPR